MFRLLVSILVLIAVTNCLLGCSRCTGSTPSAGDEAMVDAGSTPVLWPAVDSLPHGTAATGPVITGSEYLPAALTPQNVTTSGTAAVFTSSAPAPARDSTLACALYGVDLSDWRGGAAIDFTVDAWDEAGECWLALPNRRLAQWDWRGIDPRESCVVTELAHYLDDAGLLYFIVVMATASAVNLEQIAIGGEVPVVVLTTTPGDPVGEIPLSVGFDATGSTWDGGSPADFQWDFDGDWVFNETDNGEQAARGSATANHAYTTALSVNAHLLVLGDNGIGRYASVTVGPAETIHAALTDAGYPVAVLTVDGTPLACYSRTDGADDHTLCLERGDGSGGWLPVQELATGEDAFQQPGLAIINGNPALIYAVDHSTGGAVYYASATDAAGSTWNTPAQAGTGWNSTWLELAEVSDRPAVCYLDGDNGNDLLFIRAADAAGSTWGTPVVVAEDIMRNGTISGQSYSLAMVDGLPALAYHDVTFESADDRLLYVRATAADGSIWGTPVVVDSAGGKEPGYTPMLSVAGGVPSITYSAGVWTLIWLAQSDIRCARALDAMGTAWDTPIELDGLPVNDYRCASGVEDFTGNCVYNGSFTTGVNGDDTWEVRGLQLTSGGVSSIWYALRGPGGKWSHLVNLSGPLSESISARHFRIRTEEDHENMGIVVNYTIRYYLECYVTVWTDDGPEIRRFERLIHTDCFQA